MLLLQVYLALKSTHSGPLPFQVALMRAQMTVSSADMDLVLDVAEWQGRLKGRIDYSTDLFTRATIERMAGHLQAGHPVLDGMGACATWRALNEATLAAIVTIRA